uniref:Uncharacterized protein n=1 Tax=Romanomermis culicivorax TaxID=13658 RepID=A0A915HSG4_ROMCU
MLEETKDPQKENVTELKVLDCIFEKRDCFQNAYFLIALVSFGIYQKLRENFPVTRTMPQSYSFCCLKIIMFQLEDR